MIPPLIKAMILSALPISEVRGGIPFAIASGINPITAYIACVLANIAIVPIVLFFLKYLHVHFIHISHYAKAFDWFIERTRRKVEPKIRKWEYFGLILLVGIPFPFTGAYTGAIAAWLFGMDRKKSFAAIAAGVMLSGIIVTGAVITGSQALQFFITQAEESQLSGTVMLFTSDEGVRKAAVTIAGPATAVWLGGKQMVPDAKVDGTTFFLAILDEQDTAELIVSPKLHIKAMTNRTVEQVLDIDTIVSFDVVNIHKENETIILTTNVSRLEPGTRILVWTTVPETSVRIGDVQSQKWVRRPLGVGGYWIFDFAEGLEGLVDIRVTPPDGLEGEPVEDVVDVLLTKVEDFNLIIMPAPGHATASTLSVSLAQAAVALAGETTTEEAAIAAIEKIK